MHDNESTDSVVLLARQLADAGQLAQALQVCQQGVSQDASEVRLWHLIAELQAESGHRQEALATYNKAAQLLFEKGAVERAVAAHRSALANRPQDVDAHLSLAALYRKQGQSNRAALSYEMAAQALAARGKLQASLTVVQLFVDLSPENVARRLRLAEQYVRAELLADAVRELEATAEYLHRAGRSDEHARVLERLRALQADKARQGSAPPSAQRIPGAVHEEDASSLIAEADSFLRLGLIDKAIEHLAAALSRNPFLRRLREPLIRLYVAQGQTRKAVAELWALLGQCQDRQEEIRFLRYILRLDSQEQAARLQISRITRESLVDAATAKSDTLPAMSMAKVESELRSALDGHRPPTDLAITSVLRTIPAPASDIPAHQPSKPPAERVAHAITQPLRVVRTDGDVAAKPPPSATTRPGVEQIEAIAEEIALSSKTFREELAEVDQCVQRGNYEDALRHLGVLSNSYPHSQVVRAQQEEIARAMHKGAGSQQAQAAESNLSISTEIASALRSLNEPGAEPSQTTPTLTSLLSGAKQDLMNTTLEVDPADITEEPSGSGTAPRAARPPQPAAAHRAQPTPRGPTAAFKSGVMLRARRLYDPAIAELEKVLGEPSLSTRAAYLIGLCHLDQGHTAHAISWFMRGVNTPQATDAELSELFYALGQAHEQDHDAKEAILYFQLALGPTGRFRDAAQRMASLQQRLRRT